MYAKEAAGVEAADSVCVSFEVNAASEGALFFFVKLVNFRDEGEGELVPFEVSLVVCFFTGGDVCEDGSADKPIKGFTGEVFYGDVVSSYDGVCF